jgi:glucose/arabinose dehydrogenase
MARIAVAVSLCCILAGDCSELSSEPRVDRKTPCIQVPEGFGPEGKVPIVVETVVTGLEVPWGIAFLPGGDWLVTERPGRVRLVRGEELVPAPVLTLPVAADGEGGLLGIAASPSFEADRQFYVFVTADVAEHESRVLRYQLSEDHRSAVLDKVILDHIPGAKYHDGGRLRFGPDGMLYISTGDSREPALSQSLSSLAGKLLRLTPEGSIPQDNPHGPMSPVFLSGIRNSQGFDWITPRFLAVTDHGPTGDLGRWGHDEVNVVVSGMNLGWPGIYGCQSIAGVVAPSLVWEEAVPPGGAAMYRGGNIPEWTGSLLIGTLASKHLHRVAFNPKDPRMIVLHEVYLEGDPPAGHGRLRDVMMGPGGDLYVTTSNCDGRGECPPDKDRILRITR